MAINVTTSKQQITASVAEDKISATVSGGFGATGPSGVINVTAPITNAGTTTAANVGLSVGTGLSVSGGSLVVTPDTYATLVGGKVPADQLPSYVDDVLEYANLASLPGTGESGKIYVALNTGKIYRWSGSAYFEISTQPGNTDAVPEGSSNLYFTNARARNSFGTGASGQVVRWNGSEWSAGTVPIASASVVGGVRIGSGISIDGSGVISASSAYTLPTATASVLGGVKIGSGVTITDGVISVSTDYAAASHASTHAPGGADELFDQSLNTDDSPTFYQLSLGDQTAEVVQFGWQGGEFQISGFGRHIGIETGYIGGDWYFSTGASWNFADCTVTGLSYNSLDDLPTLFDGAYTSLTSVPSTFAPASHKTSHATGGSDALTASDIGAAAASHAHAWSDITSGVPSTFAPSAHNQAWSTITSTPTTLAGYGITDAVASNDARLTDARTPTSHAHGNITNAGAIGSTANLPVITTTSGVLTTGTFGTSANSFCQGNDSRLSDTRSPTAGSVTDSSITSGGLSTSSLNWAAIAPWAANTAYQKGDLVSNAGIAYRRSAAGTSGATFNTANWQQITPSNPPAHAITSSDHTATAWRAFYSNGSGVITELALGASGTVLTSGGASAAPTFSALPTGGTKTIIRFHPGDNQPPATNFATLDTRNSFLVLEFDAATQESANFIGVIPEGATLTNGLTVRLWWMGDTATSGNVRWGVSFERVGTDNDADSFSTVTEATGAANGTSGIETVTSITATAIDSLVAGDRFRLRVARIAADATNDTMTGDAQLVAVEVQVA